MEMKSAAAIGPHDRSSKYLLVLAAIPSFRTRRRYFCMYEGENGEYAFVLLKSSLKLLPKLKFLYIYLKDLFDTKIIFNLSDEQERNILETFLQRNLSFNQCNIYCWPLKL